MTGMNATTGKPLSGLAHIEQSLRDLLSTPRGTRVMRRDYGCDLWRWVDAPLNASTRARIAASVAAAVAQWEPRVQVQRVEVAPAPAGRLRITLYGQAQRVPVRMEVTAP